MTRRITLPILAVLVAAAIVALALAVPGGGQTAPASTTTTTEAITYYDDPLGAEVAVTENDPQRTTTLQIRKRGDTKWVNSLPVTEDDRGQLLDAEVQVSVSHTAPTAQTLILEITDWGNNLEGIPGLAARRVVLPADTRSVIHRIQFEVIGDLLHDTTARHFSIDGEWQ